MPIEKPPLLLHNCCAPCLPHVLNQLSAPFTVSVFFYNPNIHPEEEYLKREAEVRRYCSGTGIELICGGFGEHSRWLESVSGLENEAEGGERCGVCFDFRLDRTAYEASSLGFSAFSTTLSVSPHKNVQKINFSGFKAESRYNVRFIDNDFKKKDGYKISCALSREHGFYRQNYCGCEFSRAR